MADLIASLSPTANLLRICLNPQLSAYSKCYNMQITLTSKEMSRSRMRRFDYSFLSGMLPGSLVNSVAVISEIKARGEGRKSAYGEVFLKLESIAKVQSVKGSNAIEGIVTTDRRIEAIVNQNSAPLNHNESEIAGYRDALAIIHENADTLAFSDGTIKRLHEVMLSYTPAVGGSYKSEDNLIIELDQAGLRKVRFEPTPASEVVQAMEQALLAYSAARQDSSINQLLLIPCFILDFLCIHPFFDGNGRISRLLSLLLLYKAGFDAGRYISFEEQINKSKELYYDVLRESSIGWHENTNSYFAFIQNFVATLLSCYKELDKRFAVVATGRASKSRRVESAVLGSLLPISKKELSDILPDVSITTIEVVLARMVKLGAVQKVGSGPATRYIKPN